MAARRNITASTTYIKVDSIQTPNTVAILSTVSYIGQMVSIFDATNSDAIITNPIILSTVKQTRFTDSTNTTFINQPQGFITAQAVASNQWAITNSYPFRNNVSSLHILNVSTLYANHMSTTIDVMNRLNVENLVIVGPLLQNSSVNILNSITAYGNVLLHSSLSIWDSIVANQISSFAPVTLASTLFVSSLTTNSMIVQNNATVSSVLFAQSISTPSIRVSGYLSTSAIEIQQSTGQSVNIAGGLLTGSLSTTNIQIGGNLLLYNTSQSQTAAFLASTSVAGNMFVASNMNNVGGSLITSSLYTRNPLFASTISMGFGTFSGISMSTISVGGSLSTSMPLVTSTLTVGTLSTDTNINALQASVYNLSTKNSLLSFDSLLNTSRVNVSSFIQATNLVTNTDLVAGGLYIQQSISSLSSASFGDTIGISGPLTVGCNVTTLQNTSVGGNVQSYDSVYLANSLYISGNVKTLDGFTVSGITEMADFSLSIMDVIKQISANSIAISRQVSTGKLHVQGSTFISSIDLGVTPLDYVFHSSNAFYFTSLFVSTSLSTHTMTVTADAPFTLVTSSFHVGVSGQQDNSLHVGPHASYTGNIYTQGDILTSSIYTGVATGTLIGDGRYLSNFKVTGDLNAATYNIADTTLTSSIFVNKNLVFGGGGNVRVNAPLVITDGGITTDNPFEPIIFQSNNFDFPSQTYWGNFTTAASIQAFDFNLVRVNQSIYISTNRVGINISTPLYELHIDSNLQVKGLVGPALDFRSMFLQDLYLSTLTDRGGMSYIDSGCISTGNLIILPPGSGNAYISRNRIQTNISTLGINRFLFLNAATQSVGLGTSSPRYALDLPSIHILNTQQVIGVPYPNIPVFTSYTSDYADINAGIQITPNLINVWVATGPLQQANGKDLKAYSNYYYSLDSGNTFQMGNDFEQRIVSPGVAYNGRYWVAVGNPMQVSFDGINWYDMHGFGGKVDELLPGQYGKVAFNSSNGIAVGKVPYTGVPLLNSIFDYDWEHFITDPIFISSGVAQANDILWTGRQWIATGLGDSPQSTIMTSYNGFSWTPVKTGGFQTYGTGLCIGPKIYDKQYYFATGADPGTGSIQYSVDGQNWSNIDAGGFAFGAKAIASDGNFTIAVGSDWFAESNIQVYAYNGSPSTIFTSYKKFTGAQPILDFSNSGNHIKYNGNEWLLAGNNGMRKLINTPTAALSSFTVDGLSTMMYFTSAESAYNVPILNSYGFSTWTSYPGITGFFPTEMETNGSNMWVMIGNSTDTRCMYNSTDGVNWRVLTTAVNGVPTRSAHVAVSHLYYTNGMWFVTGTDNLNGGNTCSYSYDGVYWLSFPMWTANCTAVLYGKGVWVSIGGTYFDGANVPGDPGYAGVYWNSNFDPNPARWTASSNPTPNIHDGTFNYRFYPGGSYGAQFQKDYFFMGGAARTAGSGATGQAFTCWIYSGDGKSWSNQYWDYNMGIVTNFAYFGTPDRSLVNIVYDSVNQIYMTSVGRPMPWQTYSTYYAVFYSFDGINWSPTTNAGVDYPLVGGYSYSMRTFNGLTIGAMQYLQSAKGDDAYIPFWYTKDGINWNRGPKFTTNFNNSAHILASICLLPIPNHNFDVYSVAFSSNASPALQTSNLSFFTNADATLVHGQVSTNSVSVTSNRTRYNDILQVTPNIITLGQFVETPQYTQLSTLLITDKVLVTQSVSIGTLYVSSLTQPIQIA
jgi:hypothetical protein